MKVYKFNIQTMLNGFLFGTGTYDEERVGNAKEYIEQYIQEQNSLPYSERHIPPYFEIIDTDNPITVNDIINENRQKYYKMSKGQLLDECKVRGLDVNIDLTPEQLINMLLDDFDTSVATVTNNEPPTTEYFISVDEFLSLKDKEKTEYLDSIFVLPDGVDEGSDEEIKYYEALSKLVTDYGSNNVSKKVSEKIKEILDYCNS